MIRPFELHRPSTVAEAAALLGELPEAAVYRGGTELLQVMKMGFARFAHLIDLKRIPELHGISTEADGSLRIGAATTHRDIERSGDVATAWPALAEMERHVANPRVRSVGSIGGNLCFAEPHSDPATLLLAADARLELRGPSGERSIPVDGFILGALSTDLEPGELLVSIVLPPAPPGMTMAYRRLALAERPTASVACRLLARDGVVAEARIVVGSVADTPVVAFDAAASLTGVPLGALANEVRTVGHQVANACDMVDEPGASAEYRRHLVGVLAGRAVLAAASAAQAAA